MVKKILITSFAILLATLTASMNYGVEGNLSFDPKDPKMRDIKIVNGLLDTYITEKDKGNIERVKAHTQARASKYALLILVKFNEDLSMEKLETMRQKSPKRWALLQSYMNNAITWLSLSKKAENFLGGHLESALKKELGEK